MDFDNSEEDLFVSCSSNDSDSTYYSCSSTANEEPKSKQNNTNFEIVASNSCSRSSSPVSRNENISSETLPASSRNVAKPRQVKRYSAKKASSKISHLALKQSLNTEDNKTKQIVTETVHRTSKLPPPCNRQIPFDSQYQATHVNPRCSDLTRNTSYGYSVPQYFRPAISPSRQHSFTTSNSMAPNCPDFQYQNQMCFGCYPPFVATTQEQFGHSAFQRRWIARDCDQDHSFVSCPALTSTFTTCSESDDYYTPRLSYNNSQRSTSIRDDKIDGCNNSTFSEKSSKQKPTKKTNQQERVVSSIGRRNSKSTASIEHFVHPSNRLLKINETYGRKSHSMEVNHSNFTKTSLSESNFSNTTVSNRNLTAVHYGNSAGCNCPHSQSKFDFWRQWQRMLRENPRLKRSESNLNVWRKKSVNPVSSSKEAKKTTQPKQEKSKNRKLKTKNKSTQTIEQFQTKNPNANDISQVANALLRSPKFPPTGKKQHQKK